MHTLFKSSTGYMAVLPTANLRALVVRNAQRFLPGCNYKMEWKDVNGFGINLAVSHTNPAQALVRPPRRFDALTAFLDAQRVVRMRERALRRSAGKSNRYVHPDE